MITDNGKLIPQTFEIEVYGRSSSGAKGNFTWTLEIQPNQASTNQPNQTSTSFDYTITPTKKISSPINQKEEVTTSDWST